jgi:iron complex outermembrane recepter protein
MVTAAARGTLLAGMVLSGALAPVAMAQERPPAGETGQALEEIVVTSQRRTERLQEVPISVSAYSQQALDNQGVRDIQDVARLTPGVVFTRGQFSSESSNIAIRGIDSNAGAATTGVYIEDTPIQSRHLSFGTFNAYPALFDIERVEVLRGPQGTLFGAGSEGGTVRFLLPEPGLRNYSSYVRSEFAMTRDGAPSYEFGGAIGGPLASESLGFRASASFRHDGGYVDRIDWHTGTRVDSDSNWSRTATARLALKWVVLDGLAVTPSFAYQELYVNDTSAYWAPVPGSTDPTGGQFNRPFKNGNVVQAPSTDAFSLPALKVDWDLGSVRLLSNTSYYIRHQSAVSDYTHFSLAVFAANPYPPPGSASPNFWSDNQRNFTQEIRLESKDDAARVNWVTGLFYQRARENTTENVYAPTLPHDFDVENGLPPGTFTAIFGPTLNGFIYRQDPFLAVDKQVALYGQADVRLTGGLKVTLGLRVSHSTFDGRAQYAGPVVGPTVSSSGSLSENPITPKMGLQYNIGADNMVYATAAKGYRIGGANPEIGIPCDPALHSLGLNSVPSTYRSDSVWSYEIGTKNSFAERRISLNASAYLIKWKDIQQNVYLASCGFQFVDNLGAAQSKGFDLQTDVRASTNLTLGATFSYTNAAYTQTVILTGATNSFVQDGDHLPGSPWALDGWTQYAFPAFGSSGYVRADYQYHAHQTDAVPNQDALNGTYAKGYASVPAQSDLSLRTGVKWSGFDISVFASNVFDSRPKLSAYQDVGSPTGGTPLFYVTTFRPRTLGLTAIYRY